MGQSLYLLSLVSSMSPSNTTDEPPILLSTDNPVIFTHIFHIRALKQKATGYCQQQNSVDFCWITWMILWWSSYFRWYWVTDLFTWNSYGEERIFITRKKKTRSKKLILDKKVLYDILNYRSGQQIKRGLQIISCFVLFFLEKIGTHQRNHSIKFS